MSKRKKDISKSKDTSKKRKKRVRHEYYVGTMYEDFLEEFKAKELDFTVEKTTYTKTIKVGNRRLFFNSEGGSDWSLLRLINLVRNDAKEYYEYASISPDFEKIIKKEDIDFFKLYEKPSVKEEIVKVDLKSAYWKYALERGIISQKTDEYFNKMYAWKSNKEAKQARLKALGSLATRKRILTYIEGQADYENEELKIEPTKELYMEICRGVDEIMRSCASEIHGVYYYYWDCIFVSQEYANEVVTFFKNKGYNTNVDQDTIEYIEIQGSAYIISTKNDKCYMVRQEDKNLVQWLENNEYSSTDYLATGYQ